MPGGAGTPGGYGGGAGFGGSSSSGGGSSGGASSSGGGGGEGGAYQDRIQQIAAAQARAAAEVELLNNKLLHKEQCKQQ